MKKEDATVPAEPAQPTEKAEKAAPAESPDQAEQAGQAVSGEQTDAEREKEREQERERFLDKVEKFALVLFVGLPCAIFLFLLGMETMYAAEHSGWQEALAFCGLSLAFFLSAWGVVTLLGLAVERIAACSGQRSGCTPSFRPGGRRLPLPSVSPWRRPPSCMRPWISARNWMSWDCSARAPGTKTCPMPWDWPKRSSQVSAS